MTEKLVDLGNGFWSIRGELKLAGVVDLGTQASLIERPGGGFVMLDSYTLPPRVLEQVRKLTDGGRKIEAIVNVHPFHTLHCEAAHRQFPDAKLYGLDRHKEKYPDLPWEAETTNSEECQALFADCLEFSVPDGIRLVCSSEHIHAGSVLAYHPASQTLHVDDTLSCTDLPFPASLLPMSGRLDFHPTIPLSLEKRDGAVDDFRAWAKDIAQRWSDCRHVACAHSKIVTMEPDGFEKQVLAALHRAETPLKLRKAAPF